MSADVKKTYNDVNRKYDQARTEARFWAKVRKTDTCWLWTASLRNKGYGAFAYTDAQGNLVQDRAHRYSYELHVGPIPEGLFVLHKCDVPACVNPDHLFIGTKAENVRDMVAKGRHVPGGTHTEVMNCKYKRGERHHNAKLTAETVIGIRELHSAGDISLAELARRFGISQPSAYRIVKRLRWTHI